MEYSQAQALSRHEIDYLTPPEINPEIERLYNRMSGLLDRKYMLETQLESIEEEIECLQSQIDEVEYYGRQNHDTRS